MEKRIAGGIVDALCEDLPIGASKTCRRTSGLKVLYNFENDLGDAEITTQRLCKQPMANSTE